MTKPSERRPKPAGAGERRFLEELEDKRQDVRDLRRALNRIEPESPAWNAAAQRVLNVTGEQLDFEDRARLLGRHRGGKIRDLSAQAQRVLSP